MPEIHSKFVLLRLTNTLITCKQRAGCYGVMSNLHRNEVYVFKAHETTYDEDNKLHGYTKVFTIICKFYFQVITSF